MNIHIGMDKYFYDGHERPWLDQTNQFVNLRIFSGRNATLRILNVEFSSIFAFNKQYYYFNIEVSYCEKLFLK